MIKWICYRALWTFKKYFQSLFVFFLHCNHTTTPTTTMESTQEQFRFFCLHNDIIPFHFEASIHFIYTQTKWDTQSQFFNFITSTYSLSFSRMLWNWGIARGVIVYKIVGVLVVIIALEASKDLTLMNFIIVRRLLLKLLCVFNWIIFSHFFSYSWNRYSLKQQEEKKFLKNECMINIIF